jgi:spore coat protein CotH
MIRNIKYLLLILLVGCSDPAEESIAVENAFSVTDWTDASHGSNANPDYTLVFPQDKVNTLEIAMTTTDWLNIQSNMTALYGAAFSAGGQGGGGFPSTEPDYVSVSMKFNGKEWYKVGFRLKGNSTLRNSWRNGIYKLPFRLNMDRYEDQFPQIKNQRFYGFKELSMSPGANDNSLIREKAGSDIFRAAGIPSSQTAFYKVYIDYGSGLKYCGVYTMVEVVDDTMIENQFGTKSGNIYKPESNFQSFLQNQFEKKNNETENDYSDVQSAITALNSTLRLTDPLMWRANLEKTFNVDHYMKWLAINTTMLNWDTYGRMAHNYYLYNEPGKGLLWIPWDNNECMLNRAMGNTAPYTISLSTTTADWPLIRNLMDDPVYYELYRQYMKEFTEHVFTSEKMNELFTRYHTIISPYVIGPDAVEQGKYTHLSSGSAFTSALESLKQHVVTQNAVAAEFLE